MRTYKVYLMTTLISYGVFIYLSSAVNCQNAKFCEIKAFTKYQSNHFIIIFITASSTTNFCIYNTVILMIIISDFPPRNARFPCVSPGSLSKINYPANKMKNQRIHLLSNDLFLLQKEV